MDKVNIPSNAKKPPYLLGLLGLIPLVGFFVGAALVLYGVFKYKDRKLIIIGSACILFTVLVYSSLYYFGFKSEIGKKAWERHSKHLLNTLIKHVEYYKLENGTYPVSLTQLTSKNEFVSIVDPTQSINNRKTNYFNYKNLGQKYLLFSSGLDGIPNTNDDIYPDVNVNSKIGWIKNP